MSTTRFGGGLIGCMLALAAARAAGPAVAVHSGPAPVTLIELFTSEGCSSCPPAEAWLGDLRHAAGLWRDFVPVAWHVNYWDHLGWRDPLADPGHTGRQRRYAAAWGNPTIYTPGLVRNGDEWRPSAAGDPAAGARRTAGGKLDATWTLGGPDGGVCTVEFQPADPADRRRYTAHAVLLGGGIVSAVRRGENAGRTLRHEFVALRLATGPLGGAGANGPHRAELPLPARPDLAATRRALAVWVTAGEDLTPVQAAGGWLGPAGP